MLDANKYLSAVRQVCETRQLHLTPLRAQVLGLVAAAGKPIKAYELLHQMILKNGSTAPMTMYRTLDFLCDQGFIHRLATLNAYVGCNNPQARHSVPFLICDSCQKVVEIKGDLIVGHLKLLAKGHGFKSRAQTLEVYGLCADCSTTVSLQVVQ